MSEPRWQQPRFPQGRGLGNGQPDLWCTYAAIRSLAWVERLQGVDAPRLQAYIQSRFNRDGGYAWSKGMPSDAWATFYCTETLKDLGLPVAATETTQPWLDSLFDGQAYGMCQGQDADVWASHYAVRTLVNVCHGQVREPAALREWLGALQCENGGLSWSPGFARRNQADVRACFYGVMAWKALRQQGVEVPAWDMTRLVLWLQLQQLDSGGFRFSDSADTACLWATYRATATLAALDRAPLGKRHCVDWIHSLRGERGAFVRWPGYDAEDVWAVFCAVGSLKALGEDVSALADDVSAYLATLCVDGGGYTYREADSAADVLSSAAGILGGRLSSTEQQAARRWIEGCQMPNEAGIMYMPGRGSEVRCTAWGLAAGAFAGQAQPRRRILQWLASLQNPDGGFGFWEGRGSDMVSTASAVSILMQLGDDQGIDLRQLEAFVLGCGHTVAAGEESLMFSNYPRAGVSLRASLQAFKCLKYLGREEPQAVAQLLARHAVRQGGFANQGNRIPDLLSTYEAIAASVYFDLPVAREPLRFFLGKVQTDTGHGWSPLFREGQDGLSRCLGHLLETFANTPSTELPHLYLS